MAKLFETNKTINPSTERTFNTSNRDSVSLSSKRTSQDINKISNFINSLIVPSYKSLTSDLEYPYDVLEYGISGNTIVTWTKDLGNSRGNHPIFWKVNGEIDLGRPCTVKESFDWILENFTSQIREIEQSAVDLSPLEDSIRCVAFQIEKLKNEVLTETYSLDCEGISKRIYEYSLSTHVFNILYQLTEGMDVNFISPYNDPNPDYPTLTIPYSRISDRVEFIYQLKDVHYPGGDTKAGNGQILVFDSSVIDPDLDADDTPQGAWVPRYPNEIFQDTDTNIEFLDELKDVTVTYPLESDKEYYLYYDKNASGPDGMVGQWMPKELNFINEVSGENLNQRLGNINYTNPNGIASTLEDVESIVDDLNDLGTAISSAATTEEQQELFLDFLKASGKKYRPGSILQFNGWDRWHSNLGGNISNLNLINFVPELASKNGGYLNTLSNAEKTMLSEGSKRIIPFVFANSFRISFKKRLDPFIVGRIRDGEYEAAGGNPAGWDEDYFLAIMGGTHSAEPEKLNNLIEEVEKINSVGMTSCNIIYREADGSAGIEYSPEYMLGVIRTDLEKVIKYNEDLDLTYPISPFNITSSTTVNGLTVPLLEPYLNGSIDSDFFDAVNSRALSGVGAEIQHSGYSKVMVLGPYEIGDNVYICPLHILKLFKINYPYGIVITDSFFKTPIIDFIEEDPGKTIRVLLEANANRDSLYLTLYEYLESVVESVFNSIDSSAENYSLVEDYYNLFKIENYNKFLSSPVGFITKEEIISRPGYYTNSEGATLVRENIANSISKNLLTNVIGNVHGATFDLMYNLITGLFSTVLSQIRSVIDSDNLLDDLFLFDTAIKKEFFAAAHRASLCAGEISLPVVKIQLPGVKYEPLVRNPYVFDAPSFDWGSLDWDDILKDKVQLPGAYVLVTDSQYTDGKDAELVPTSGVSAYESYIIDGTDVISASLNSQDQINQVGIRVQFKLNVHLLDNDRNLSVDVKHTVNGTETILIGDTINGCDCFIQKTYLSDPVALSSGGVITFNLGYNGTQMSVIEAYGEYKLVSITIIPVLL